MLHEVGGKRGGGTHGSLRPELKSDSVAEIQVLLHENRYLQVSVSSKPCIENMEELLGSSFPIPAAPLCMQQGTLFIPRDLALCKFSR